MRLYDGESTVEWYYAGTMTREQMESSSYYAKVVNEPCVLFDDADGRVVMFEPLSELAVKLAVPTCYTSEQVFDEVKAKLEGTYKAPGVAEAQATADEAKQMAEQAGTDPQLQALATMQVATMDLTSYNATQVASFRDYWRDWEPGIKDVKQNDCFKYEGKYWRASQAIPETQAIYPPGTSESLYYPIEIAPDGIIVYRTCHGQYDMVRAGEKRHYPDAEGPVYRAKVDTAYDPDTVPGDWEKDPE